MPKPGEIHVQDAFGNRIPPTEARPLTLTELASLHHQGFTLAARSLVNGVCDGCGHAEGSTFHQAHEARQKPEKASGPPRQPWDVRPSRRAA